MGLSFTDTEIYAEAVRLGLVADGDQLPRNLRSRVVASLAGARQNPDPEDTGSAAAPDAGAEPERLPELTVYGRGRVLADGAPFPYPVIASDPIEVVARHGGPTTVRLTIAVGDVHLLTGPEPTTP